MHRWTLLVLSALLTWSSLLAQEFRATITGRVIDSSGAIVPSASVTAANIETGATSRTVTAESGQYVLPNLAPGMYRLDVEHAGFKKYVREGLRLQVQDRPTIDVTLEPGDVQTVVNVTAEAPLLEASDASRGEVISGRTLVDLPLNGRNAFALAGLTPGVSMTARTQASTFLRTTANAGISAMSISGSQPRMNEALLDGVPNTGTDGLIQFVPSVDATQEFRVQTNSFDAEFGRFTGGLINAVIKSGTNDFHGSAFEFLRNSAFNARDPFATSIPQFGYNLFGGSAGGPIRIPKLYDGRNRTFFFANYEGSREGVPRAFVSTVPTLAQRRGDFSDTRVRSGSQLIPVTIYDPNSNRQTGNTFTRDPFAGNQIPADRFNPVALKLLALFPEPNATGDAATGANNYQLAFKDLVRDDGYVFKIDHRFSDRHSIFGRYSWRRFTVGRQGAFKNPVTGDSETRDAPGFAFDDTYTLTPTTILNFRYGFARFIVNAASDNLGTDLSQFGFPASFVRSVAVQAIPRINVSGYATLSGATKLRRDAEDAHTFRGGITHTRGIHNLRAGAEFRLLRSYVGSLGDSPTGVFNFDQVFTRGPNPQVAAVQSGHALASFLLGLGSSGSVANNAATAEQIPYYGVYFQDDVRLGSRLTINLGLRYELEGEYTERYNRINRGFAAGADSPLSAAARTAYAANPIAEIPASQFQVKGGLLFAGVDGQPRGLADLDRNNIAPRVGAAFRVTPKTVLRGGYGLFYGASTLSGETRLGFSASTPFVGTINSSLTPVNTLSDPFPDGLVSPPGASQGLLTLAGQGISFVDTSRRQPFSHQYQFSVQRELPWAMLADVGYSGSQSGDLAVDQQINAIPEAFRAAAEQQFIATGRNILNDSVRNPFSGLITTGALNGANTTRGQLLRPYPQFTSVVAASRPIGDSRYDSVQAKVTKRFSSGFSMIAAYTFSKLLERLRFLNDQDLEPVWELNENDIPQRFTLSSTYELPFGRGQSGLAGKLIAGWQLNVIYTAQSGVPLTITGGESTGKSAKIDNPTVDRWFDTTAFRQRQTLEQVRTARLPDVRTAGKNNFDMSVFKTTSITERLRLQFRAESFNTLNRPEWFTPNTAFGNANFGRVTSTNTFARQLQFGLKLLW
jgi:hypothetical protein